MEFGWEVVERVEEGAYGYGVFFRGGWAEGLAADGEEGAECLMGLGKAGEVEFGEEGAGVGVQA